MKKISIAKRFGRIHLLSLLAVAAVAVALAVGPSASANHPVFVEGNCNPYQYFVTPGTCGDYDADGRVGAAEDGDNGTDRIFGTISGALGNLPFGNDSNGNPINATTANQNGRVVIVTSGRFNETVTIGFNSGLFANPGNVQLEAAPGVDASIDAVAQGDPNPTGNTNRQNVAGVTINSPNTAVVTLRNLTIRNYTEGIRVEANSRVNIENCSIDNNRNVGIRVLANGRITVNNTRVVGTGFRANPAVDNTPNPGDGIRFEGTSRGWLKEVTVYHNFRNAISTMTAAIAGNVITNGINTVGGTVQTGDNGVEGISTVATPSAAPDSATSVGEEP